MTTFFEVGTVVTILGSIILLIIHFKLKNSTHKTNN